MTDDVRVRMRAELKSAMKGRDKVAVAALRSGLAAIDNAEAVQTHARAGAIEDAAVGVGAAEADRRELSPADIVAVLRAEADERTTAAAGYSQLGQDDHAAQLRAEAQVLARFV